MYDRFRLGLVVYRYGQFLTSYRFNPRYDTIDSLLFKIQELELKHGRDAVISVFSYECRDGEDGDVNAESEN